LQNLRLRQCIGAAGNTLAMGLPTAFAQLNAGQQAGDGEFKRQAN
jgi:hypothetical protein